MAEYVRSAPTRLDDPRPPELVGADLHKRGRRAIDIAAFLQRPQAASSCFVLEKTSARKCAERCAKQPIVVLLWKSISLVAISA